MRVGIALALFLFSCARVPAMPIPLSERQPEILFLVPEEGEMLSTRPRLAAIFSRPIDESSLGEESVLLWEGTVDGTKIPLQFSLREEGRILIISTEDDLIPEKDYALLITSRILSLERLPVVPLTASYRTAGVGFVQEFDEIFEEDPLPEPEEAPPPEPSVLPEAEPSVLPGAEPTDPPVPVAPNPVAAPKRVVLNEIYYDAVGSDIDGLLFIELYGTPEMGIDRYQIHFVNGEDGKIYDSITLPEGAKVGSDGFYLVADSRTGNAVSSQVAGADLIDNFDPQNGPDGVQLVDPTGRLVDAVGYGEGVAPLAENGLPAFEGSSAPDVINGRSLERREPGLDTDHNLADFVDRETPTPGR